MRGAPENPYRAVSEEEIRRIDARGPEREMEARAEEYARLFDQQVETLLERGYAEAAGMARGRFRQLFATLKREARDLAVTNPEIKEGHIPFVIVVKNSVVGAEKAMRLVELEGKKGYTTLNADVIEEFEPIRGVKIPNYAAYLAVDIETGKATLGMTPDDAIKEIEAEGRSPLSLEEGVALVTHYPEILKDHYIDLSGSRLGDDKVADLLLNGGQPGLGWYWAYKSNAKWGSASCGSRVEP